jgi:hypothetical protein
MHLYLKYQSPNTFGSKDIAQVKVFQNFVKVQDQGHKIESLGTIGKASISQVSTHFLGKDRNSEEIFVSLKQDAEKMWA